MERPRLGAGDQALAGDDLEDVAGPDVLLRRAHDLQVVLLAEVALVGEGDLAGRLDVVGHGADGCPEPLYEPVNAFHGLAVGRVRIPALGALAADDLDGLVQVVEDDHLVEEHEEDVRQGAVVRRAVRQALHEPHHVVGHVADRAAGEAGQPLHRHERETVQVSAELVQRVVRLHRARLAAFPDGHLAAGGAEQGERGATQEAVAADLLRPAGALQEEGVPVAADLLEGQHGGEGIGHELAVDGHDVALTA